MPAVVEKIFGYLDMDALTQARRVSKAWRGFVDLKTPHWKTMTSTKFPDAAFDGRLDIVERMIEYGKPKDFTLLQALEGAVLMAHTDIVKRIFPLMDRKYIVKPLGKHQCGLLHYAAAGAWVEETDSYVWKPECWEILNILIEHFDNKNPCSTFGQTPMHLAANLGNTDCVKAIMDAVEEEFEKCPEDAVGDTPLHWAAAHGRLETCRMINEVLPDNKNMRNKAGETPADIAREEGHEEIVDLLNN